MVDALIIGMKVHPGLDTKITHKDPLVVVQLDRLPNAMTILHEMK